MTGVMGGETTLYADDKPFLVIADAVSSSADVAEWLRGLAQAGGSWAAVAGCPDPFTADEPDMNGVTE